MRGVAVLGLLVLSALAVVPAEASVLPPPITSPLNCALANGACGPLSGVGSLVFGGLGGTLTVDWNAPAGMKIVGGSQLDLNLASNITGPLTVTLSINGGAASAVSSTLHTSSNIQVDGCINCFNFEISGIPTNASEGSDYFFTITGNSNLSMNSVVDAGDLDLDAQVHVGGSLAPGGSVYAGEDPTAPVPEPGTMLLIGTGLVGLGGWARRKNLLAKK